MNDFIEENKKTILLIIILILATIIFSVASLFMSGNSKNPSPEVALEELGEIYYEELYYNRLVEEYPSIYLDYLAANSDGIEITLVELLGAIQSANTSVFDNKKFTCDLYNTYISIIPHDPYGIEDYSIEVVTDCK